jgi:putative hydrolases of HD superfamily
MPVNSRDLDFLFEIGSLRNVPRGWRQHLGMDCASDPEHSFRVAWLALIIARMEGVKDEEKILKMALVHDLAETRTSDHSYVQKVYVTADEHSAAEDTFRDTTLEDIQKNILEEYERRESIESQIVKDADNLDIDFELMEFEEKGSKLPAKWLEFRKLIREQKLYTESAKQIWDSLQTAEVSNWHLSANKWIKHPNAGK